MCTLSRLAAPFSRRAFFITALAILGLTEARLSTAESAERVAQDLLALYTFDRPTDDVIHDRSGTGEPLNLRIEKSQGTTIRGGRLIVTSSVKISSAEPARKVVTAVKQSNALTIEAWVKPQDTRQAGPARIVTLSADPGQRNFTFGQDAGRYDVRLRTTSTDGNGIPSTPSSEDSLRAELTHVVFTRDPQGSARIYLNGKEAVTKPVAGQLSNWSDNFRLSLANELTGDRPWLGELSLVAIYGRALSADEVSRNFAAGVPAAVNYAALLPPASSRQVDFVKDVQPLLRKHCFECHAAGNEEGGVNLGIRQRVFEGGDHGAVLIKEDSANSRLIQLVAALDQKEVMPPADQKPLSKDEVGLLRAWIDQGAKWPDGADVLDPRAEQAKHHWAFQPLRPVAEPAVRDANWSRTTIDRFILARLESAKIRPQSPASSRQLIRRVTFDLIGLPPTPDEVREFTAAAERDPQEALAALVDRLLKSPHYGERWGRHWLDVARYADSDGQETDRDRPLAYRYRDFVIRALNDDMPFDQFVRWQLAGNEYEPDNPAAVAATGFLTAGTFAGLGDNLMEDERLRNRYNELDDIVSTIGSGLLGLTLGCVRCHDHKYDAIPARDYYSILSALHSGDRGEVTLSSKDKVYAYRDSSSEPKPTWLFRRGDFYDHEKPVRLGFVSVLTRQKTPEDYWKQARDNSPAKASTLQRRAMAEWMTDAEQGAGALVARVIVNRVWQHHFGEALVRTVGDFGVRSEPPTHPELLEWLTRDLVEHGWQLKRLHRLILTSATYQQASTSRRTRKSSDRSLTTSATSAADPDNRLLWKMRPQRLEAEILRDAMLAVSGSLNLKQFGPGFKPPISSEAIVARNTKDPYPAKVEDSADVRRRSVYMFHKRVVPYPLLLAFDKPDAQQGCNRRDSTTVAPQALALLNDPFVRTVALDFADRLIKEVGWDSVPTKAGSGQSPNLQVGIERGYQLVLGRLPSESERSASLEFVQTQITERTLRSPKSPPEEHRRRALADLCQAWFSLNEFLYID